MAVFTSETGQIISSMARACSSGQTEESMTGTIRKESKMEKDYSHGQLASNMTVTGETVGNTVKAPSSRQLEL